MEVHVECCRHQGSDLDVHLLEVLCCHGCIMGAGMSTDSPLFSRRRRISDYVRACGQQRDLAQWQKDMDRFADLDLSLVRLEQRRRGLEDLFADAAPVAGAAPVAPVASDPR